MPVWPLAPLVVIIALTYAVPQSAPMDLVITAGIVVAALGHEVLVGDLDYEHATAVQICEKLGVLVVSTDHRKAPEHPHPAPDAEAARHMWTVRFRALRRALGIPPVPLNAQGSSQDS